MVVLGKSQLYAITSTELGEPKLDWLFDGTTWTEDDVEVETYRPVRKGSLHPFSRRLRPEDIVFRKISDLSVATHNGKIIWTRGQAIEVF